MVALSDTTNFNEKAQNEASVGLLLDVNRVLENQVTIGPAANQLDRDICLKLEKDLKDSPSVETGLLSSEDGTKCGNRNDEVDPWEVPALTDNSPKWNELDAWGKVHRVLVQWIGKAIGLLALLYLFICSLSFLSSAFRLLGGRAAGQAFSDSELLQNPITGLMIGILATVLLQSSSTSTSIVVTMVASDILEVRPAIPIIMGANIGTSVTNTIVSLAQSGNMDEFRRAFGGATVHDMFNWLSVIVLLPIEAATGYLYHLTGAMLRAYSMEGGAGSKQDFLKAITKPFTDKIIKLDKKMIEKIATGHGDFSHKSMIKDWCVYEDQDVLRNVTATQNMTVDGEYILMNVTETRLVEESVPVEKCKFLFHGIDMSDTFVGGILLLMSLAMLVTCLILMVKLLNSVLRGKIATVIKKTLNSDFPGCCSYFTGYIAIFIGAGMTILVQSSSVFTSAMTPLVGIGVIRLERMYPLTLGSNIGTTTTGLLAAMAASGDKIHAALQIALCHLMFNITGILLFYPIPALRLPIRMAKMMGNTTAKYRWFAVFYLVLMFFLIPGFVFSLSMAGTIPLLTTLGVVLALAITVFIINIFQKKCPHCLPKTLRTWSFLPKPLRSLEPYDRIIRKVGAILKKSCCGCCGGQKNTQNDGNPEQGQDKSCPSSEFPPVKHTPIEPPIYDPSRRSRSNGIRFECEVTDIVTRSRDAEDAESMKKENSFLFPECDSGFVSYAPSMAASPDASRTVSRVPSIADNLNNSSS